MGQHIDQLGSGKQVVLIAPDKFRGTLSAFEAALAIEAGIRHLVGEQLVTVLQPISDGGEGFIDAISTSRELEIVEVEVLGPLRQPTKGRLGIYVCHGKRTAVVEMASASGLSLIPLSKRDPWMTTSFGTGQLIKKALDLGADRILIGLGGSATIDGGIGVLAALGIQFISSVGDLLDATLGAKVLCDVQEINVDALDHRLGGVEVVVACDTNAPLLGPNNAIQLFGPQKGLRASDLAQLEKCMHMFMSLLSKACSIHVGTNPYDGASGGIGASLKAICNAKLMSGIDVFMEEVGLVEKVRHASCVITGEGKLDCGTLSGKAPIGVAGLARKFHVPVIGIFGTVEICNGIDYAEFFDIVISVAESEGVASNKEYRANAAKLLSEKTHETVPHYLDILCARKEK